MQQELIHETITDAIREVIQAAGGFKPVGARLWPEMPVDHAAGKLRDATNPDRREKLSPEQVMLILKLGREVGSHAAIRFVCAESGYQEPIASDPEDERAKLQREFTESSKALMAMAARIERLSQPTLINGRTAA